MKILYIHGLSSSGNSETAACLRRLLPYDIIISPDLPVEPMEALELLERIVKEEKIDLAIGTSMGGMFAQKLRGTPKFLVNPSFHVSRLMRQRLGVNKFLSERQDGVSEYEITPELCDRYEELERTQFDQLSMTERFYNTRAFFDSEDDVIDCREEYCKEYGQLTIFPGGHRLTEEVIRGYLLRHIERHRRWIVYKSQMINNSKRFFREKTSDPKSIALLYDERFRAQNVGSGESIILLCNERVPGMKNCDAFTLQDLQQKCDIYAAYISYAFIEESEIILGDVRQFLSRYQGKQCSLLISVCYAYDYERYYTSNPEGFKSAHIEFVEAIHSDLDTDVVQSAFSFNCNYHTGCGELFVIVGENRNMSVEK